VGIDLKVLMNNVDNLLIVCYINKKTASKEVYKVLNKVFNQMLFLLLLTTPLNALTLTDNFNNGIKNNIWNIERYDALGSPWTILAPDGSNKLKISKPADSGASISAVVFHFRFVLDGDFTVWIDFDLIDLPLANNYGWNHVGLVARTVDEQGINDGTYFGCALHTDFNEQISFGYANIPPPEYFGGSVDSTMHGKLGISRENSTMSAWIDRGNGPFLLGALTYPELIKPVKILFSINQQENISNERPSTSLDLRFDNFTATAETITPIIPEPYTLLLLLSSLSILFLHKKKVNK